MRALMGKAVVLSRWLFGEQRTSAAIDITSRCNLACTHCYWWRGEQPKELSDGDMICLMERLRAGGLRAAILYGGEPTLRLNLCREAARIFDTTLVFTNGTGGFPELPGGQWILSLDGPRQVNDQIRGAGVYDLVLDHLRQAAAPPLVHMTVSRLNCRSLEPFVRDMIRRPVKGVGFSFYTPRRGEGDRELAIPLNERDGLVRQLLSLREHYGRRVGFTHAMARQLLCRDQFPKWNRYGACPVYRRVLCLQADGSRKPCTYGDEADCSRCGCAAVAAYRGAFKPLNLNTLAVILGLMAPGIRGSGGRDPFYRAEKQLAPRRGGNAQIHENGRNRRTA